VIDEVSDRDSRRKLRHRAEVIAVIVRGDQVIDSRELRVRGRGHDPRGVTRGGRAAVARVDQQRLAGRRDEQGGVAPFDIHHVDVQRPAGPGLRRAESRDKDDSSDQCHRCAHRCSPSNPGKE
jgi:hypothetical protein